LTRNDGVSFVSLKNCGIWKKIWNEVISRSPDIIINRWRSRIRINTDSIKDINSGGRVKIVGLMIDKRVVVDGAPGDAVVVLPDDEADVVAVVH
jgi:hypothetical protein